MYRRSNKSFTDALDMHNREMHMWNKFHIEFTHTHIYIYDVHFVSKVQSKRRRQQVQINRKLYNKLHFVDQLFKLMVAV